MLGGVVPFAPPNLGITCLTALVALLVMLPFYALGWMGAGDVKLLAVLGFLLGPQPLFIVWVLGNALLAIHTICFLIGRQLLQRQPQLAVLQLGWERSSFHQWVQRPRQGRKGMPYAAYLGVGVFLYVFGIPSLGGLT